MVLYNNTQNILVMQTETHGCGISYDATDVQCMPGSGGQMDIVFVIPVWGVSPARYHYALMFVGNVTSGLDIDSDNVRVGVVALPWSPLGQFYLGDYVGRRQAAIDALRLYGHPDALRHYYPELGTGIGGVGDCETLCALDRLRNEHLTGPYGARPGVRKVRRTDCVSV